MQPVERSDSAGRLALGHFNELRPYNILRLALVVSFAVVTLEELLRNSPVVLLASPVYQAVHWASDALMALPLAAAAIWAGDRLANRSGLRLASAWDAFARACLIAALLALLLVPGWFAHNEIDQLTQPQSLLAAHSSGHGGHSAGTGGVDTHWVAGWVIYALLAVPLAAIAVWAGHRIASRFRYQLSRTAGVLTHASVITLLLALVLVPGWLLQKAADQAQASQVYYTGALLSAPVHPHGFFSHTRQVTAATNQVTTAPPVTGTPFALAYQVAYALQDGLAAQAIGLPVTFGALLWWYLRQRGRISPEKQIPEEGTENELAWPN